MTMRPQRGYAPLGQPSNRLKEAAKRVARPVLAQFEGIHAQFVGIHARLDHVDQEIALSTNHLAVYIGKVETEMHELRTQISVDVEVLAELTRVIRRVVRELEGVAPEVKTLIDTLVVAAEDSERRLERVASGQIGLDPTYTSSELAT